MRTITALAVTAIVAAAVSALAQSDSTAAPAYSPEQIDAERARYR